MSLEQFIPKTNDQGHFAKGEVNSDPTEFFVRAHELLDEVHKEVIESNITQLEQMQGRWHPLGFMVYHLGVNPTTGESLRLHIWPSGERIRGDRQPNIHNHGWHLASKVLAGEYEDTFLEVGQGDEVADDLYALRPYTLTYHKEGIDSFETDGTACDVSEVERRVFDTGHVHTIPAGIFHIPRITDDRLTATLVLDSPSFDFQTTVILMGVRESFQGERRPVKYGEAIRAKKQLLEILP